MIKFDSQYAGRLCGVPDAPKRTTRRLSFSPSWQILYQLTPSLTYTSKRRVNPPVNVILTQDQCALFFLSFLDSRLVLYFCVPISEEIWSEVDAVADLTFQGCRPMSPILVLQ